MPDFTYDDIVRISDQAPESFRRGAKAWIIAVISDREKLRLEQFPDGIIYTVEYEDGSAVDVHESCLEAWDET